MAAKDIKQAIDTSKVETQTPPEPENKEKSNKEKLLIIQQHRGLSEPAKQAKTPQPTMQNQNISAMAAAQKSAQR